MCVCVWGGGRGECVSLWRRTAQANQIWPYREELKNSRLQFLLWWITVLQFISLSLSLSHTHTHTVISLHTRTHTCTGTQWSASIHANAHRDWPPYTHSHVFSRTTSDDAQLSPGRQTALCVCVCVCVWTCIIY